jgi:hypothetical protein
MCSTPLVGRQAWALDKPATSDWYSITLAVVAHHLVGRPCGRCCFTLSLLAGGGEGLAAGSSRHMWHTLRSLKFTVPHVAHFQSPRARRLRAAASAFFSDWMSFFWASCRNSSCCSARCAYSLFGGTSSNNRAMQFDAAGVTIGRVFCFNAAANDSPTNTATLHASSDSKSCFSTVHKARSISPASSRRGGGVKTS